MATELKSLSISKQATQADLAYVATDYLNSYSNFNLATTQNSSLVASKQATQADVNNTDPALFNAFFGTTENRSIIASGSHKDLPDAYTTSEIVQNSNRYIAVETLLKANYNVPQITDVIGNALIDGCTYAQLQALVPDIQLLSDPVNNLYRIIINDVEIDVIVV